MPLQEYFCLSERSIHDSYLCLANVSSFLCLYFCLCKKTRGLRANQKHNKIMHISMWAVIRVVLSHGHSLCFVVCSSGRDLGTRVTTAAALSGWHKDTNPTSLLQPDPSVLHLLHCFLCKPCLTILRAPNFSSGAWEALSWCCCLLPTAGIALQILCMTCTFDKH